MTYAAKLGGLAVVGSLLMSSAAFAQSGTCVTASGWRTGNNSDESEQYIGERGENGMILLEFYGPDGSDGQPAGYTTFTAPIEGLVRGARYRLDLVFQRTSNGREVSLSAAGLQPQSRVVFRRPQRQTFQRSYVADGNGAAIMIHMRGHNKMWSFAGLPRLCRI